MSLMGLIRVKLPEDLDKRMRNAIPARKGAISEFIIEAIREKLERLEKEGK